MTRPGADLTADEQHDLVVAYLDALGRIDKLAGLRKQDDFVDFSAPEAGAGAFFGNQYIDLNGASWQEINLQLLAQQVDFLTIAA